MDTKLMEKEQARLSKLFGYEVEIEDAEEEIYIVKFKIPDCNIFISGQSDSDDDYTYGYAIYVDLGEKYRHNNAWLIGGLGEKQLAEMLKDREFISEAYMAADAVLLFRKYIKEASNET